MDQTCSISADNWSRPWCDHSQVLTSPNTTSNCWMIWTHSSQQGWYTTCPASRLIGGTMQGSMLTVGGRNGKRLCLALQGDEASKSIMMVLLSFQRSKPQRLRKGTERILRSSAEAFELEPTSFRASRIGTYGNLAIHLCNKFFSNLCMKRWWRTPADSLTLTPTSFGLVQFAVGWPICTWRA